MKLKPVKPPLYFQHWTQPKSQGTLIRQTKKFPVKVKTKAIYIDFEGEILLKDDGVELPKKLNYHCAYSDRMWRNEEKWKSFVELLGSKNSGQITITYLLRDASDDVLIEACSKYFDCNVHSVRCIYYFNVATGYDCPAIEILYKE